MRRISFAALGLLLAATLAPQALYAAGNVLLPSASSSSDGSTASLPNLGLSASTPSTDTAAPTDLPAMTVTKPALPPATVKSTVAPTQTPSTAPAEQPTIEIPPIAPITDSDVRGLPPGTVPTRVIHQPDASAMPAASNAGAPNSLTIGFSPRSYFGARDAAEIGNKLGISRDQISASCYLSVGGVVQTDKGSSVIAAGLSPQVTVHYAGTIKSYMIGAQAMCVAGNNLPPGSGFIVEIGNRFVVPLQQINCAAPNRQSSTLTLTYNGNNGTQCVYN